MVYAIVIVQVDAFNSRLFFVQHLLNKAYVIGVNESATTRLCKDTRINPILRKCAKIRIVPNERLKAVDCNG